MPLKKANKKEKNKSKFSLFGSTDSSARKSKGKEKPGNGKSEHKGKGETGGKNAGAANRKHRDFYDLNRPLHYIAPVALVTIGLFFGLCLIPSVPTGKVGPFIRDTLRGFFAYGAYPLPLLFLIGGFCWREDIRQHHRFRRFFYLLAFTLVVSIFSYILSYKDVAEYILNLRDHFNSGKQLKGGGVCGGLIGYYAVEALGPVLTGIISVFLFAVYTIFFFQFDIPAAYARVMQRARDRAVVAAEKRKARQALREERAAAAAAARNEQEASLPAQVNAPQASEPSLYRDADVATRQTPAIRTGKKRFDPDVPLGSSIAYADADTAEDAAPLGDEPDARPAIRPSAFGVYDTVPAAASSPAGETESLTSARTVPPTAANDFFSAAVQDIQPQVVQPGRGAPSAFVEQTETVGEPAANFSDFERITVTSDAPVAQPRPTEPVPTPAPAPAPAPAEMTEDGHARITADMIITKNKVTDSSFVAPPVAEEEAAAAPVRELPPYEFPPITLLDPAKATNDEGMQAEIQSNANKLVDTLASFNVHTHITTVSRGPRITRYELVPETGIRIRAIANLVDDIAMNLASAGIRIEAPIPGKAAVGIEVPNRTPTVVCLRDLLDTDSFRGAEAKTTVCLGADVTGDPVYTDLAKMPHMLIAGATGMGKSVCINVIINSLLYKARPEEVKLILIDPKKVELNVYSGIPHLLVPVVSDPNKAAGALSWAVNEMERRFDLIESFNVRDIKGYNKVVAENPAKGEPLPKIVIIIDELNDLMMTAHETVEASICRIAQKARAAGIHLIIGTQRPSVDVITGVIKANIPSRIAFRVSSQVDSRTILDTVGAEKLLNNGDMLFSPIGSPRRVQGAFISDNEVERVVNFIKGNAATDIYNNQVMEDIERETAKCIQGNKKGGALSEDDEGCEDYMSDPKFTQAIEVALEFGKISTSLIQRKLSIGYGKAAKYIDAMEAKGIVSPPEGQKPRDVLITRDQYLEMMAKLDAEL